jgi:hypothetical protein
VLVASRAFKVLRTGTLSIIVTGNKVFKYSILHLLISYLYGRKIRTLGLKVELRLGCQGSEENILT